MINPLLRTPKKVPAYTSTIRVVQRVILGPVTLLCRPGRMASGSIFLLQNFLSAWGAVYAVYPSGRCNPIYSSFGWVMKHLVVKLPEIKIKRRDCNRRTHGENKVGATTSDFVAGDPKVSRVHDILVERGFAGPKKHVKV